MNKYEIFLDFFGQLAKHLEPSDFPKEVTEVLDIIKNQSSTLKAKPLLTESGMQILEYLQSVEGKKLKASDIAQGMDISSRKVSGSIRKLVSDEFVEKFGKDPVIYSLTEKGKNFDLESYKESLNNEESND